MEQFSIENGLQVYKRCKCWNERVEMKSYL